MAIAGAASGQGFTTHNLMAGADSQLSDFFFQSVSRLAKPADGQSFLFCRLESGERSEPTQVSQKPRGPRSKRKVLYSTFTCPSFEHGNPIARTAGTFGRRLTIVPTTVESTLS